jgi:hypothetical protein
MQVIFLNNTKDKIIYYVFIIYLLFIYYLFIMYLLYINY